MSSRISGERTEPTAPAMSADEFRAAGHQMVDWIAEYLEDGVEGYPVCAQVKPDEIRESLPPTIPATGEAWEKIWGDFERLIIPGITHWQSPNFFAYFPANVSFPSILGELLSAGLGVNGMLWSTSPAATELETHVLDMLVDALHLPSHFKGAGVIQDTASSAAVCAILCAREQALDWQGNERGLASQSTLAVYASDQAHSSIEKGAKIAGIGRQQLRLIPTDRDHSMDPVALTAAIEQDLASGIKPALVSATLGTTSSLAIDPIPALAAICKDNAIWLHVDAAMAGSALICPEFHHLTMGLELVDSFCFNPHKWLLTNFDCNLFYVRQPERLIRTLTIMPEYLRANQPDAVINYRDWQIPLGRRFRALKLWFVLRSFGMAGLQNHIRTHIGCARQFADEVTRDSRFKLISVNLNLVCFRLDSSDELNEELLNNTNSAGRIFLTHTEICGQYTLRFCPGQANTQPRHTSEAWGEIVMQTDGLRIR